MTINHTKTAFPRYTYLEQGEQPHFQLIRPRAEDIWQLSVLSDLKHQTDALLEQTQAIIDELKSNKSVLPVKGPRRKSLFARRYLRALRYLYKSHVKDESLIAYLEANETEILKQFHFRGLVKSSN